MGIPERKARDFKRRERAILEAAFNLFLESGVDNVTIDMIAESVEIGKGTIYKHFKSKHEIFAILFLEHLEEMQKEIEKIDKSLPVINWFREVIRIYVHYWVIQKERNKVFRQCMRQFTIENLGPELYKRVNENHLKDHEKNLIILQKAIDNNLIIDVPPHYLMLVAEGLMLGVGELLSENHLGYDIDDTEMLVQLIENVIIKGFLKST